MPPNPIKKRLKEPKQTITRSGPLERELQRQWLALLRLHGIFHWRYAVSALPHMVNGRMVFKTNPLVGFPDTCGLTANGRFWAAELKSEKGRLSPKQKAWLDDLNAAGALVAVLYDWDDCESFLGAIQAG